ncbi:MAG TPA: GNAT family N-acetyltransferase [Anaeromyxobacteraceae bacterium]|nr:GNAT family N-acetyltransferase [Anaeromyxobacteraceae bacterium]
MPLAAERLPPGARRLDVEVHAAVAAVPAAEWDALVDPDDLLAQHWFVRVCEESGVEQAVYRHVAVRDGGALAGIATLSLMRVRLDLLSGTGLRGLSALVRRAHPSFLTVPVLIGGLPVSFGTSLLRVHPEADAAAVVAAVAGAAEAVAAELGAPLVVFKEFAPRERPQAAHLAAHGWFEAPSLPGCALELRWPTFDAYLASLRAGYRRQLRADLAARARGGLRLRRAEGLGGRAGEVFALYEQVMDRAPYQLERLPLAFFTRLEAAAGPRCRTLLLERGDDLLAAAILLRAPRSLVFLLAGMDYARARAHRAYQNLVAEVVAEAIRDGAARVELGQTSYLLKGRLGGVTSERLLYLRHRRPGWHRTLRLAAPALFPRHAPLVRRIFRAP